MALLFPPDRADLIRSGRREGMRFVLDGSAWASLANAPGRADLAPLLGLWGDPAIGQVHALFHDGRVRPLIASVAVEAARYHALSGRMPAAAPYERIVRDLCGFEAMHARDLHPLLDHGVWPATAPLAPRPGPPGTPDAPEWRGGTDGISIIETGPIGRPEASGMRMRATLAGTEVRDVELRAGYGHRGLAARLLGLSPEAACGLAERLGPCATVAHATAFARAAEAASAVVIPVRASALREAAAELERATALLTTLVEAAAAGRAWRLRGEAMMLLERLRAACLAGLGHRFGAGLVVPGGLAHDLGEEALDALVAASDLIAASLGPLTSLYEARDGLAARLAGVARLAPAEAATGAASGIVGRASGQGFDARRLDAVVAVEAPASEDGCTDARLRLRLAGVGEAGTRLRRLLDVLTPGPVRVPLGPVTGEGLGVTEAPEGDLWHFVRLDGDGVVRAFFARAPSLPHIALFERASRFIEHEDLGLVRASFGLSAEAIDG